MTRIRRRTAKRLRHSDRFSRTVEEEVRHGIAWADYRHTLPRYLLPEARPFFDGMAVAPPDGRRGPTTSSVEERLVAYL